MSNHNTVAQPIFDQALEVIKKTSPHFVPATYACVQIVNGRPADRYTWVNAELSVVAELKKRVSLAEEYRDDHVEFCLKNHLGEAQRDDVMIVIVGIVPMNESVAPDWDKNTPESVRKNDIRLTLDAHCFFQSTLK